MTEFFRILKNFITVTLRMTLFFYVALPSISAATNKCQLVEPTQVDLKKMESFAKTPRYTQGVLFFRGSLIESFGMTGHSGLQITSLKDKKEKILIRHSDDIFAEGITILGNKLFQLNYQSEFAFVFDLNLATQKINQNEFSTNHRYEGEGWGLTTHNNQLVMSNGSAKIRFADPSNLKKTINEITVHYGEKVVGLLNELEMIDGNIWANLYGTEFIAVISPTTGCIQKLLNFGALIDSLNESQAISKLQNPICYKSQCSKWDFVMNGIAYDKSTGMIYLTGKNWPLYYKFHKNDLLK